MRRALVLALLVAACHASGADGHAGHAHPAPLVHEHGAGDAAPPTGYAPVTIDERQASSMGLTTAKVERRGFDKTLRTVGVIAIDETRSAHVHTKIRGWIDTLQVDFVGKSVNAGTTLCTIYSQDVYAAEIEFLSILDRTDTPAVSGEFAASEKHAQAQLLAAAGRRLALWDVPRAEIDRLKSTREARRTFPLLAPRSGRVLAKQAVQGMYVDPSLELFTLSDLSHLWALIDVYEPDVPNVHVGDHAELAIEGLAEPRHATVSFLPPSLDEATRTLKARVDLDNTGGNLRPGAFVSVELRLAMGDGLAVPEDAVIRTGTRSIVFVAHGEHLEPREVGLGPLVGGHYRVEAGLAEGDVVATGAQFLLDSESRLRATSAPVGHVH